MLWYIVQMTSVPVLQHVLAEWWLEQLLDLDKMAEGGRANLRRAKQILHNPQWQQTMLRVLHSVRQWSFWQEFVSAGQDEYPWPKFSLMATAFNFDRQKIEEQRQLLAHLKQGCAVCQWNMPNQQARRLREVLTRDSWPVNYDPVTPEVRAAATRHMEDKSCQPT